MMKVTYYALKPVRVGEDIRQIGDLVPEAQDWRHLTSMIQDGQVAPVLVGSLPEETQEMLLQWEEDAYSVEAVAEAVDGDPKEEKKAEGKTRGRKVSSDG